MSPSRRDVLQTGLTVIVGGKPTTPPPAPMIGFMHVHDAKTYEPGGYGRVSITPRPDGSFIVRPLREGVSAWTD